MHSLHMIIHERHYTLRELEELTQLNYHTLRRRLMNVPGVVHLNSKKKTSIRVPESIWNRVYGEWTGGRR